MFTEINVPGSVLSASDKYLILSSQESPEYSFQNLNVTFEKIRLGDLTKVQELGPAQTLSALDRWVLIFSQNRIVRYIHGMGTYVLKVSEVRKVTTTTTK